MIALSLYVTDLDLTDLSLSERPSVMHIKQMNGSDNTLEHSFFVDNRKVALREYKSKAPKDPSYTLEFLDDDKKFLAVSSRGNYSCDNLSLNVAVVGEGVDYVIDSRITHEKRDGNKNSIVDVTINDKDSIQNFRIDIWKCLAYYFVPSSLKTHFLFGNTPLSSRLNESVTKRIQPFHEVLERKKEQNDNKAKEVILQLPSDPDEVNWCVVAWWAVGGAVAGACCVKTAGIACPVCAGAATGIAAWGADEC